MIILTIDPVYGLATWLNDNVGLKNMTIFVILFFIGFFLFEIRRARKNKRKIYFYRKGLRVGDETSDGTILKINGDIITVRKEIKIQDIYPVS